MKQYADLPMDLVDASLVILAEQLGQGVVILVPLVTETKFLL
jgi:predicted nucleic acid-binding protein